MIQGEFGAIDEKEESLGSIDDKKNTDTNENDEVDKVEYNRERRRSSFSLAKLGFIDRLIIKLMLKY